MVKRALVAGLGISMLLATPAGAAVSWPAPDRDPRASRSALHPKGTTRGPARAVAYLLELAEARAGGYWGQCLKLADDAYMPTGPRVQSAFAQWHRAKDAGVAHPKDPEPPLGAQMFWDPGHASGHVATYVGDGKAVTNMPDGSVKAIKWREMNDWGPYLGWADPYYK
jgi:hypothetical protein